MRLDILYALGRRRRRADRRQCAVREDPAEDGGRLGYVLVFSGRRSMRALSTPVSVSGMLTFTISRVARQWLFSRTMCRSR